MRLSEGDMIGSYKVLSTLGAGAMGAVYRVYDTRLEVERALKIIKLPELADEAELREYRQRFFREAKTIANLHVPLPHPNIIQVHDMGELQGVPWFTMSSFPGVSLTEWMSQQPRPHPDRALHVMKQLAAGLAHAHKRGVKHRDIKLGNALVSPSQGDHAVLIDWGIAKADTDQNLTMTGAMSGTESYMAPEYLVGAYRGEAQHTELTDLWSLGVVFYALAIGKRAFDASQHGYQNRIIEGRFVPVLEARGDLDDTFAAVITDLLRVKPQERIQSAADVVTRLSACQRAVDPNKPPHIQSGTHTITPALQQDTASTSKVPNFKVVAPDPSLSVAPQQPTTPARSKALDPFAVAQHSPPHVSADGLPLDGTEDLADDLFGTAVPSRGQKQPAVQAPHGVHEPSAVSPAPLSSPPSNAAASPFGSDGQTFLRALTGAAEEASPEPSVVRPARTGEPNELQPQPGQGRAQSPADDDGSIVREPLAFGSTAAAARANRSKVEARRAIVLAGGAVTALVVVGFGVTSAFDSVSPQQQQPREFVDPSTVAAQRDAKQAIAEIEREKKEQAEQQKRLALAMEEQQRRSEAAAAAVAAAQQPLEAPPPAPAPQRASHGGQRANVTIAAAPTPAAPPPAPTSRYGSRTTGNSAAIAAQTGGASTAASTSAAVEGIRIPARLKAQATSAPGPIIAIVTKETQVGTLRIPAGTEVHGTASGTTGPRLNITFSTALIGGRNVSLRGSALGADQRGGIPGRRTLGNGSETASQVAGSLVASAGAAAADAVGLAPVADATRTASNSASNKAGRLNNEEDLLVVPASSRFFIYVQGL